MKTQDLTGPALDWAVAKAEGHDVVVFTIEEQRQRWFSDVPPEKMDKETKDFETYILPALKPEIRMRGINDYKRHPTHEEAKMLWGEGIPRFAYSSSWSQGGPIIEREGIALHGNPAWCAQYSVAVRAHHGGYRGYFRRVGPTPLIAAMRCFVASRLGATIDIPEELQ